MIAFSISERFLKCIILYLQYSSILQYEYSNYQVTFMMRDTQNTKFFYEKLKLKIARYLQSGDSYSIVFSFYS